MFDRIVAGLAIFEEVSAMVLFCPEMNLPLLASCFIKVFSAASEVILRYQTEEFLRSHLYKIVKAFLSIRIIGFDTPA